MSRTIAAFIALLGVFLFAGRASASVIFDDFNVNAGHFGSAPTASGQTNVSTASSAGRVTSTSFEGDGSMRLGIVTSATAPARIRFLSGIAIPSNNVSFTTSNAVDGFIGFYYRTAQSGINLQLLIEDSTNTSAGLSGSTLKPVIGDDQWHLVEWDLDTTSNWGQGIASIVAPSAAINTSATLKSYTIDSVYIQSIPNPVAGTSSELYLDFFAKSDGGTIAALAPEPSSALLLLLPALSALKRRKR